LATKTNLFENALAENAALTVANSGYTGNDAADAITGDVRVVTGLGGRFAEFSVAADQISSWLWTTNSDTVSLDLAFHVDSLPRDSFKIVQFEGGRGKPNASVVLRRNGTLQIRDRDNDPLGSTTTKVVAGELWRLRFTVYIDDDTPADNEITLELFSPSATSTPTETENFTNVHVGPKGGKVKRVRVGILSPVKRNATFAADAITAADSAVSAPTFTSFSPTTAVPGGTVTWTGTNLTGTSSVTIGGLSAPITSVSATEVEFTVPQGAETGAVTLTAPGGQVTSGSNLTIVTNVLVEPTFTEDGSGTFGANFGGSGTAMSIASHTYDADTLYDLTVVLHDTGGNIGTPTVSGTNITWTLVASRLTGAHGIFRFRAVPTAQTTTALTVNVSPSQEGGAWLRTKVTDFRTGGTNGAEAVGDIAMVDSTSGVEELAAALDGYSTGAESKFLMSAHAIGDVTISAGDGETLLKHLKYTIPSVPASNATHAVAMLAKGDDDPSGLATWTGGTSGPVLKSYDFENGTDEAAVVETDPSGTSNDADDVETTNGATMVYDTAVAAHGTRSARVETSTTSGVSRWEWNYTANEVYMRCYFRVPSSWASTAELMRVASSGFNRNASLRINASRVPLILDSTGANIASGNALQADVWHRAELHVNIATGRAEARIYSGGGQGGNNEDGTTPNQTLGPVTGQSLGSANAHIGFGQCTGATNFGPLWIDDVAYGDSAFVGPYGASGGGTGAAVPAQAINIEYLGGVEAGEPPPPPPPPGDQEGWGPTPNTTPAPSSADVTISLGGKTMAQVQSELDAANNGDNIRLTGHATFSSGSGLHPPDNSWVYGPCEIENTGSATMGFDLKGADCRNVTLSDMEIHGFEERGVRIWIGCFLLRLDVHDCVLAGIGNNCDSLANLGMVIDSCELHHNGNTTSLGNNTSGLKVTFVGHPTNENARVGGSSLIVRNCHVHDNTGSGLWTDHGCAGVTFEYNLCENNVRNGIMHELSIGALIRRNICRGNQAVQIAAISSAYADIIDNRVGNGPNPILRSRESFRSDIPGGTDWEDPGEPGILIPAIANTGKGYPTYVHNIRGNGTLTGGQLTSANVQLSMSNTNPPPGGGIINYDPTPASS
jgi:hypothetical protein